MNLGEIKQAVADGKTVCYKDKLHWVIKAGENYYIRQKGSKSCVSLVCFTYTDKLNGNEEDFFVAA